jgi:hypothetical protein
MKLGGIDVTEFPDAVIFLRVLGAVLRRQHETLFRKMDPG